MNSNVSAVSGSVANGHQGLASRFHKPPVSSRTVGFPESGWRPWHFFKRPSRADRGLSAYSHTPPSTRFAARFRENISGLQSFHYVQAPTLDRLPGCTHRSLSARRPGRLHHAPLGWLPAPSCGIATYPNRATDTAVLSPAGLQPCRMLRRPCYSNGNK